MSCVITAVSLCVSSSCYCYGHMSESECVGFCCRQVMMCECKAIIQVYCDVVGCRDQVHELVHEQVHVQIGVSAPMSTIARRSTNQTPTEN